jgi:hypothetical protein
LQADVVGYAVNQLAGDSNERRLMTNQFRIGLYAIEESVTQPIAPIIETAIMATVTARFHRAFA